MTTAFKPQTLPTDQQISMDLSGRSGLAPRFWGDLDRVVPSPNLRYVATDGQLVQGYWNPFRRYGYASPANATMASVALGSTAIDAQPWAVEYDDLNNEIMFAGHGQHINIAIPANNGLDAEQLYYNGTADIGSTGTPTIYDLQIYQVNGVRKVFAFYEKSGNLTYGYWSLPLSGAGSVTEHAMGGGISLNYTAFARVADNGFMYVFSDANIHKFDGTVAGGSSGTETDNVIQFPVTFTIQDAIDYRGYLFVGIVQGLPSGTSFTNQLSVFNLPCGIYVWDRQSTTTNSSDFIPLYGARAILKLYTTENGALRAMVLNSESILEIREYDGTTFNFVAEMGRNAFPGCLDGVTQVGPLTVWLANSGDILAHGKIFATEAESIFKIGRVPDALGTNVGDAAGCIFFGGGNSFSGSTGFKAYRSGLFVGYEFNSTPTVKIWDMYGTGSVPTGAQNQITDETFAPLKYLPQMATITHIDLYMANLATSGTTTAATVNLYYNGSSTLTDTFTVTRDDVSRGYKRLEVNKPYVTAVQISWVPAGGNTTAIGVFDFAPAAAVINYVPTITKG